MSAPTRAGFGSPKSRSTAERRITLTFSEAIVDPSGVDPSDFRLSLGRSIESADGTYAMTLYSRVTYDPNGGSDVVAVSHGAEDQMVLETSEYFFFEDYCEMIEAIRRDLCGHGGGSLRHGDLPPLCGGVDPHRGRVGFGRTRRCREGLGSRWGELSPTRDLRVVQPLANPLPRVGELAAQLGLGYVGAAMRLSSVRFALCSG